MYNIYAKIKTRKRYDAIKKVTSTSTAIYSDFSEIVTSSVKYSNTMILDDSEWFYIENFSNHKNANEIIKTKIESVSTYSLKSNLFNMIGFIFVIHDNLIFFQNITKARLLKRKCILSVGNEFKYNDSLAAIHLNERPDAIYNKGEDKLYFQKLSSITGIFKGIDQLYREATEQEVEEFLHSDCISLADDFCAADVTVPLRKRITSAKEILSGLAEDEKKALWNYIEQYCPESKVDSAKFAVGSRDDLKKFLDGIEQRFYTTDVRNKKRLANSFMEIPA